MINYEIKEGTSTVKVYNVYCNKHKLDSINLDVKTLKEKFWSSIAKTKYDDDLKIFNLNFSNDHFNLVGRKKDLKMARN